MKLSQFATFLGALLPWVEADSGFSRANFTEWTGWGANYYNNRWASENTAVSSSNINSITQHCKFSYPRGISATPVVSGSTVFYPTWNGSFVALDYTNCHIQWTINVTSIIVEFGPVSDLQVASNIVASRSSPQIDGNLLYFGTLASALMVAVNRTTGEVLDVIQIDAHPAAIITMSPTFYDGKIIIGVSSSEESYATQPGYKCCTFVGHLTALSLDVSTKKFKKIWDVPMIPPKLAATGWSGASVWGSQPAIDSVRGQVLIGTGNIYTVPDAIKECQTATKNITAVLEGLVADPCLPDTIWQESILAIDIELGIVNWVRQLTALDAWNLACLANGAGAANCPGTPGPDYDFGMAPTFVPGSSSTPYGKDTLIVGQKSGELWALSAQAGAVLVSRLLFEIAEAISFNICYWF
jgi:outer membrane protein assembly factor BamB